MQTLYLILLIIAAVLFALAAFFAYKPRPRPPDALLMVALGLLAWVLVPLIQTADALNK